MPASSIRTIQVKLGRTWLRNTDERMNTAVRQKQKVYSPASTAKRAAYSNSASPNQPRPARPAPNAVAGAAQAVVASATAMLAASSSVEKTTPPAAPV